MTFEVVKLDEVCGDEDGTTSLQAPVAGASRCFLLLDIASSESALGRRRKNLSWRISLGRCSVMGVQTIQVDV
jgi:hypothetical protein